MIASALHGLGNAEKAVLRLGGTFQQAVPRQHSFNGVVSQRVQGTGLIWQLVGVWEAVRSTERERQVTLPKGFSWFIA